MMTLTTACVGPVWPHDSSSTLAAVKPSCRRCAGPPMSSPDWHCEYRQVAGRSRRYSNSRLVYLPGPAVVFGARVGDACVVGDAVSEAVGVGDVDTAGAMHPTRNRRAAETRTLIESPNYSAALTIPRSA